MEAVSGWTAIGLSSAYCRQPRFIRVLLGRIYPDEREELPSFFVSIEMTVNCWAL
jgi:hypothetical protein